jgi:hypothetical protein
MRVLLFRNKIMLRNWPALLTRWMVLSGSCFLFLGCDLSGEYEARRASSLAAVAKQSAVTKYLGAPTTVPDPTNPGPVGTKVSFSVPKLFGTNPADGNKISSSLNAVTSFDFANTKGEGPSLYICVQPNTVGDMQQVMAALNAGVLLLAPQAQATIAEEQLSSPADVPHDFKFGRMTVEGEQSFILTEKSGGQKIEARRGITQIFIVPAPAH